MSTRPRQSFVPGQICWSPVPHVDPVPRILDVEREEAERHDEIKFCCRNANRRDDFRKRDRSLPIKNLELHSNEELLAQRAKKRPAVIVGTGLDIFPDIARLLTRSGKKHLQEDSVFIVPIYGIATEWDPSGFPPEMVIRIRYMLYRQFFFLPGTTGLSDGVVRFDRMQTIVGKDPSAIEPTDLRVSLPPLAVFLASLVFCMTGKLDEELTDIRELLRDEYEKQVTAKK